MLWYALYSSVSIITVVGPLWLDYPEQTHYAISEGKWLNCLDQLYQIIKSSIQFSQMYRVVIVLKIPPSLLVLKTEYCLWTEPMKRSRPYNLHLSFSICFLLFKLVLEIQYRLCRYKESLEMLHFYLSFILFLIHKCCFLSFRHLYTIATFCLKCFKILVESRIINATITCNFVIFLFPIFQVD
jgi:hypothetical protein